MKKEEYSSLIDNLSLLLLKPSETFDVQFVVKNEKVLAHSFILCARSSYLKRMISNFKKTGVDNKPFSIPILEDYSVQDVILMRNWFYQDTFGLDIQANQATKLLTLAEKWLLPEAEAELLRALILFEQLPDTNENNGQREKKYPNTQWREKSNKKFLGAENNYFYAHYPNEFDQ